MVDIREQSPLAMAFVGDAVYSLLIREHLVTDKRHPINKLNKMSVNYVSAKGQFLALELIKDILYVGDSILYPCQYVLADGIESLTDILKYLNNTIPDFGYTGLQAFPILFYAVSNARKKFPTDFFHLADSFRDSFYNP